MPDNPRIEELRRRVQKDPASIAFAQLAEEYRRAGHYQEAIRTCRAGLTRHPEYLSARVTLGRSLIETHDLDLAQAELERVLRTAPENLAAIRGLAEIHHRRGDLPHALKYYRTALTLARNDPDLEQTIEALAREIEPTRGRPEIVNGLSFEQVQEELLSASGAMPAPAERPSSAPVPVPVATLPPAAPGAPADAGPLPAEQAAHGESDTTGAAPVATVEALSVLEAWLAAILEDRERRHA